MNRRACIVAVLAVALSFVPAHAETNSPERLAQFAKLPDWTGIWMQNAVDFDVNGRLLNLRNFKFAAQPPYKPEWDSEYRKRLTTPPTVTVERCVLDFPSMMESPQPFEIMVTPEETLLAFGDGATRRIYTDGRSHPPADELWPTTVGSSIGHWEGDTLVVDTIQRRAGPVGLTALLHLSNSARFTERIRMVDSNTLENRMTIDDPEAFTRPWTVVLGYNRVTYTNRIIPYDCEFDRVETVDGKATIAPP